MNRENQIKEASMDAGYIQSRREAFQAGAKWADESMLKEIDFMIDVLSRNSDTPHGDGQLAAWKEMRLFFR